MTFNIFFVLFVNAIKNLKMSRITLIKTLGCWLQLVLVHQEVVLCNILTAKCEKMSFVVLIYKIKTDTLVIIYNFVWRYISKWSWWRFCLSKLHFIVRQRPKLLAHPGPCGKHKNLSTNIIKLFTQLIVHLL